MTNIHRTDIRILHPLQGVPPELAGQPRTVLIFSDIKTTSMPDDVTTRPGPCRTVDVALILTGVENACRYDVILPARFTGLPEDTYLLMDSYSTVWLPPSGPVDRFGEWLGSVDEDADEWWEWGCRPGRLDPVEGDPVWRFRGREAENLTRLTGWW